MQPTLESRAPRDLTRRRIVQAGLVALVLPAAYPAEAQIALAAAIGRTARFRALSQRCAKAYAQLALEVLPDSARDVMTTAQRLIQVGFDELGRARLAPAIALQLAAVQQESASLGQLLAAPPSRAAAIAASVQADRMLVAANKATESLEAHAKQSTAKLVNLAGRQRMLSQRLAKNYMLVALGVEPKPLREQIATDRALFVESLGTLGAAPLSNGTIRDELALGQQQWVLFDAALARKPDANGLNTVATTSERLLEVMNNLTGLYEAVLRDLLGTT